MPGEGVVRRRGRQFRRWLRTVRKAVGALLGGATGTMVAVVADAAGVALTAEQAAAVAMVLAMVGAWAAPPNEQPAA